MLSRRGIFIPISHKWSPGIPHSTLFHSSCDAVVHPSPGIIPFWCDLCAASHLATSQFDGYPIFYCSGYKEIPPGAQEVHHPHPWGPFSIPLAWLGLGPQIFQPHADRRQIMWGFNFMGLVLRYLSYPWVAFPPHRRWSFVFWQTYLGLTICLLCSVIFILHGATIFKQERITTRVASWCTGSVFAIVNAHGGISDHWVPMAIPNYPFHHHCIWKKLCIDLWSGMSTSLCIWHLDEYWISICQMMSIFGAVPSVLLTAKSFYSWCWGTPFIQVLFRQDPTQRLQSPV